MKFTEKIGHTQKNKQLISKTTGNYRSNKDDAHFTRGTDGFQSLSRNKYTVRLSTLYKWCLFIVILNDVIARDFYRVLLQHAIFFAHLLDQEINQYRSQDSNQDSELGLEPGLEPGLQIGLF